MKWGKYWEAAHQESKDLGFGKALSAATFNGSIIVEAKKYHGFSSVVLPSFPASQQEKTVFSEIAHDRVSARTFSGEPIQLSQLADILHIGAGVRVLHRAEPRMQPSAGKRYPIELYVLPFKVEGLESCIYHYQPISHALEKLFPYSEPITNFTKEEWLSDCAALILFTGVFARTAVRYGARSYRYVLLEAGHIAQLMLLEAQALGIAASPIGGIDDRRLESLLDIDGTTESIVYSVVIGRP